MCAHLGLYKDRKSTTAKDNKMKDKTSYALGLSMANQFRSTGIHHLSIDDFTEAFRDIYEEKPIQVSYEEAQKLIESLFERISNEEKELNKKAGEEYQKVYAQKEGVVTLPSGVQYEILKKGDGPKPTKTDSVEVHYHGTLINGKVFDSSRLRGKPALFPVTAVIPGWTEILQLMPVGSTWRVVIPSNLAYGEAGAGADIRPNMTLVFEIELLKIEENQ